MEIDATASDRPSRAKQKGTFWAAIRQAYRDLKRNQRLALFGVLLLVLYYWGITWFGPAKSWSREPAAASMLGLLFAGMVLMMVSSTLLGATQHWHALGKRGFQIWSLEWQPRRLHQIQAVFPSLALIAAACFGAAAALAVGLVDGSLMKRIGVVPFGAMSLLCIVVQIVAVSGSTRFLYNQAREHSEAKLALLQSQLNPHFLFNALNTVAALVRSDPKAAEVAVEDVARVLRRTLDRSQRALAPLSEEIDYLEAYLAIEEQRWGERLRVVWEIRPDTLALEVPPLCLQPLVENALKHGLSERLEGGNVVIGAALEGDQVKLWTRDNGSGLVKGWQEGTGVTNLRERLASLYGGEATLYLCDAAPGVWAVVTLPAPKVGAPSR